MSWKCGPLSLSLLLGNSLAFKGIYSFIFILIINLLVGVFGIFMVVAYMLVVARYFLFSFLCRIMDIADCIAIAPAVMTISGSIFQPLLIMLSINGLT